MDIDAVLDRWAQKQEALGEGPTLPYPSQLVLLLSGQQRSAPLVRALRQLVASNPDELPFDLGAAKCRSIDSEVYDSFVRHVGRRPRAMDLEASWAATDAALHYLSPDVDGHQRWPWAAVDVRPAKLKKQRSQLLVASGPQSWTITMGTAAMSNALAIAAWVRRRP